MRNKIQSRRLFLFSSLTSIFIFKSSKVRAKIDCPLPIPKEGRAAKKRLLEDSSTAKRLKFVNNAQNSKIKKNKDDHCGFCKFFAIKKIEKGYAPCAFAGNKYVPSCGHCKQFKLDRKKVS